MKLEYPTLRDNIAMSLDKELLPDLKSNDAIAEVAEWMGIKFPEDPVGQIKWAMKYQAKMRYLYADEILKARTENN